MVDNCDATLVYADAEYVDLFTKIRPEIPQVEHVLIFGGEPGEGQASVEKLLAEASSTPAEVAESSTGSRESSTGSRESSTGSRESSTSSKESQTASEQSSTMIYTSGTTGKPKGAFRTTSPDPEQSRRLLEVFGYRPDDVYLTTGPIYHSGPGGFMGIAHALGNTVVVQRKFDPEDWLRLVDKYRVTSTFSAPTPIRMIANLAADVKAKYDRTSMRVMVANAAPWSYALKEAYLEDFPEESLFEVYGRKPRGWT